MLKLKVGDKAVVYDNGGDHQFETGTVVRIVEKYFYDYFAVPENSPYEQGQLFYSGGWFVDDDDVFALQQEEVADIE